METASLVPISRRNRPMADARPSGDRPARYLPAGPAGRLRGRRAWSTKRRTPGCRGGSRSSSCCVACSPTPRHMRGSAARRSSCRSCATRTWCRSSTSTSRHENQPYFVMDLLEGRDLETKLARRRAMPLTTVVAIVEAVASALMAAHRHGIVHRDLKPSNIFLCDVATARRDPVTPARAEDRSSRCSTSASRPIGSASTPDRGVEHRRDAALHGAGAGARDAARRSTPAPISSRWPRSPTRC